MLINHENNNLIRFERENWKEWFRFEVGGFTYNERDFVIPKGYYKAYSLYDRDTDIYWFVLCIPFVKLFLLGKKLWWIPARWLYKKGYFEHNKGEAEHWLWFKKIRFIRIK